MRSAAGGLADDGGALLILQIKGELLGAGKGPRRGQYKDGLLREPWSGQVREGPVLFGRVLFAVVDVDQVCRLIKEVAGNQCDHVRLSAAVLPQIEDESIGMGHKAHRCCHRWPAERGIHEAIELDVADVIGQDLNFAKGAVVVLHLLMEACLVFQG